MKTVGPPLQCADDLVAVRVVGEHQPVCKWCQWSSRERRPSCFHPLHNAAGDADAYCEFLNYKGRCDLYSPSLWTRILQCLGVRLLIPRVRPPPDVKVPRNSLERLVWARRDAGADGYGSES